MLDGGRGSSEQSTACTRQHSRTASTTDGRVKTLEQTRHPQLIQTPVVSFLALQLPSTSPTSVRRVGDAMHIHRRCDYGWKKTDSSPCWSDAGTAAAQGVVFKSLSRKWLYIENAVRCIWLLKSNPNATWIQTSPATPFPAYFLSFLPSFFFFFFTFLTFFMQQNQPWPPFKIMLVANHALSLDTSGFKILTRFFKTFFCHEQPFTITY